MSGPLVATYRLQFREGTGFDTGKELAPYLGRLGVSHLYASPIFAASPGSTHGYDVTDYNSFEEGLGGADGFTAMSDALVRQNVGLILDFVPNHMGVSPTNHWWEDVLRWGQESRYAQTFDISWEAEKILVPVLGKPYGDALSDKDLKVVLDVAQARLRFDASGYELPIDPRTYGHIFGFMEHGEKDRLIRRFSVSTPAEADDLTERFTEHLADDDARTAIESAVAAINEDPGALHALHEAQAWRLAWWRTAREKLTYRRFFEIADLIGVRQEQRRVFRESHQLIMRLARERRLDGIRIDHVDGLADPKAYLQDLREAFRAGRRSPTIHVEKILTGEERLRTSWQIEGTTGYVFIAALSGLYVDSGREEAMNAAYQAFVGEEENLRAMITGQKRSIFQRNLAGELAHLTSVAQSVAERGLATRDLGPDTIARSIVEVATALPVYRTYVSVEGVPKADIAIIDGATDLAKSSREVEAEEAIDFIGKLLKLDFEDGAEVAGALDFTRRFQQTTGAVMAKAVEDTVFYRYNRLIALNEVGNEPDRYGADLATFHETMQVRVEDQPNGLLATSTHDTKRGEDARARLYTLSEAPERWQSFVAQCAERMAPWRKEIEPGLLSPDPQTEWGLYQSILGVLPADFDPADTEARKAIGERVVAFAEKAVREAKRWTSWTSPAEPYETALSDFVKAVFDERETGDFLAWFWKESQAFVAAGALNSLSQTVVKMAAPGVPDIYQGTELYDYSLVDPDNRRPVDFAAMSDIVGERADFKALMGDWRTGRIKAHVTASGLAMRGRAHDLFTVGAYVPLTVTGPLSNHIVAFARTLETGGAAIAIAPRLALTLLDGAVEPTIGADRFHGNTVDLPAELGTDRWRDVFSGRSFEAAGTLDLQDILAELPFALLEAAS